MDSRLQSMRGELERESSTAEATPELDRETIERLRALGYMVGSGGVSVAAEHERPRADPKDTIDLHQMIMATQSLIGRGDVAYRRWHAFCLEAQHFPDSPNQRSFPCAVVEPGEVYAHSVVYRLGVEA